MKRNDLMKAGYTLHHTAYTRGYVSRLADLDTLPAETYAGRFGEGYTVKAPCWKSTNYCIIEYWVK